MKQKYLFQSVLGISLGVAIMLPTTGNAQYELQILHASDLEGGVDAIERAPNFAAIMDGLDDTYPNTVILSAGDNYIPGPFFSASSDPALRPALQAFYNEYFGIASNNFREGVGRVDISIMNAIGFDASALGNHEFDAQTSTIVEIIGPQFSGPQVRWAGSQFPYLSANLDFSADFGMNNLFVPTIEQNTFFQFAPPFVGMKKSLAPATIITRGGEMIGVVGATTPLLASISSPGATTVKNPGAGTNNMTDLATILQPVIDQLLAAGVNKVILISHLQQLQLEQMLAPLLNGVDIIIAGGSDAILANPGDILNPGDVAFAAYPVQTVNADGDPCLIVSTDGEYSYVGRLVVSFDDMGVIDPATIADVSGPYVSSESMVEAIWGSLESAFAPETTGAQVEALTNAVLGVVIAKDGNIFGSTDVFLEGRRAQIRTEETNFGNLSADANLWFGKQVDPTTAISIKNGGGIRAAIGEVVDLGGGVSQFLPPQANPISGKLEGEISQLDIENTLRFNNSLSLVTLTATELLSILEHAVAAWTPTATPGQFGHFGGVKFSFDPTQPSGNRVQTAAVIDENGTTLDVVVTSSEVVGDPARTFRAVTLSFLLDGGDSYPFPQTDRVNLSGNVPEVVVNAGVATFATAGTEQDALAEYAAAFYTTTPFNIAETPKEEDQRIQNLSFRDDTILEEATGECAEYGYYLADILAGGTTNIYDLDITGAGAAMSLIATSEIEVHIAFNETNKLIYAVSKADGSYRTLDPFTAVWGANTLIGASVQQIVGAAINADGKLLISSQSANTIYEVNLGDQTVGVFDSYSPTLGGDIAFGDDGALYHATREAGGALLLSIPQEVASDILLGSVPALVTGLANTEGGQLIISSVNASSLAVRNYNGSMDAAIALTLDGESFTTFNGDLASGCASNTPDINDCNYKLYYTNNPAASNAFSLEEVTLNGDGTATLTTLLTDIGESHIALSPNGASIYIVGNGNALRTYDVASNSIVNTIGITAGGSPVNNSTAAVAGADGTVYVAGGSKVWAVNPGTGAAVQFGPNIPVFGGDLVFAPTGEDDALELWLINRATNRLTNVLTGAFIVLPADEINGAAILENGNLLVANGDGNALFFEISLSDASVVGIFDTGVALNNGDLAGGCTGGADALGAAIAAQPGYNAISTLTSYPNPTSGPSQVVFEPANTGRTMLEVYDMNGRNVATLFNQEAQAGQEYRVDFEGAYLPNGVYIYRLTTVNEIIIDKFMIAK